MERQEVINGPIKSENLQLSEGGYPVIGSIIIPEDRQLGLLMALYKYQDCLNGTNQQSFISPGLLSWKAIFYFSLIISIGSACVLQRCQQRQFILFRSTTRQKWQKCLSLFSSRYSQCAIIELEFASTDFK